MGRSSAPGQGMKSLMACVTLAFASIGSVEAVDAMNPEQLYRKWCVPCHSSDMSAPGTLRLSRTRGKNLAILLERPPLSADYMKSVVREGLGAMPLFRRSEIDTRQLGLIVDYIIDQQKNFASK